MWRNALRYIDLRNMKISNLNFFGNQTQEPYAKEHEDRIQVYLSGVLHCNKHRLKGDAKQCMV